MSSDLVSVVIPTYNRAYCLPRTIETVLAQTHQNWELLIVDDGSTDGTGEMITSRYGHQPRIRYVYQPNAGVSNARNTAIRLAQGDFVAFLDSDDLWKPWKLEIQLQCMRALPEIGMVWTDMEAVDPEGHIVDPRHLRTMYSAYKLVNLDTLFTRKQRLGEILPAAPDPAAIVYSGEIYSAMIMGSLVHTSTVLLRRERVDLVQAFDEDLKSSGEDFDFHLRTCKYGPVALIDLPSIQYQKGRGDQLSRNSLANAVNFLRTVDRAIQVEQGTGRFSPERVQFVLTHAHAWVADEQYRAGAATLARKHALESLRLNPRQPRLLALSAIASIPAPARTALTRIYAALKGSRTPTTTQI